MVNTLPHKSPDSLVNTLEDISDLQSFAKLPGMVRPLEDDDDEDISVSDKSILQPSEAPRLAYPIPIEDICRCLTFQCWDCSNYQTSTLVSYLCQKQVCQYCGTENIVPAMPARYHVLSRSIFGIHLGESRSSVLSKVKSAGLRSTGDISNSLIPPKSEFLTI